MDAIIECRENVISIDLVGGLARILRREKIQGCWRICMFMSLQVVSTFTVSFISCLFHDLLPVFFIFHSSLKSLTLCFFTSFLSFYQCYVSYSNFLATVNMDHRETLRVDYVPLLLNRLTSPIQTLPKV